MIGSQRFPCNLLQQLVLIATTNDHDFYCAK
jgi:hypothetical protein